MSDIVERLKDAEIATHALFDHIFQHAREEIERLRAKVEAMENQEPVARFNWSKGELEWLRPWNYRTMDMKPLYLAPSAKGEEKMSCECYRIGGPFIAEDPNCPIHGYEAQAREKEEKAYRESEEEKQNELLARIIALEEKIDAMPQCTQPAPSVPDGVAEALQRLIENGAVLGPASSEDALLVARYRQRLLACAPSVPIAALRPVIDWLRNGCDPQEAAKELEILIAAAPEAKP